ncbi:albumin-2-like [Lotus japonicus]|uniref:albumin-2-like n=1 Tax=Lotus japonicus TaxID=34305 RepID=UPI002589F7FD|nr:albumin-2-like [Lotus japonicus]
MSPIAPVRVNAAFRSSVNNEAYIFMNNGQYVLLDYAPGTTDDKILNGPYPISVAFQSLKGTPFGEHGIECAFDTDRNEAYIFSGNLCAYIYYAPHSSDDKILRGPMSIPDMFPCLKGTVFEKRIDAAFRSSVSNEAYIFTGDQYARINYASISVSYPKTIKNEWPCLAGTIFESGIEAAFASHITNEAYLFKGEQYARIKFTPGKNEDYLMGGVRPILSYWPGLGGLLASKNSTN